MGKMRVAAVHSKREDRRGRTKDKRHGTRSFTTWLSEARVSAGGSKRRVRRGR